MLKFIVTHQNGGTSNAINSSQITAPETKKVSLSMVNLALCVVSLKKIHVGNTVHNCSQDEQQDDCKMCFQWGYVRDLKM